MAWAIKRWNLSVFHGNFNEAQAMPALKTHAQDVLAKTSRAPLRVAGLPDRREKKKIPGQHGLEGGLSISQRVLAGSGNFGKSAGACLAEHGKRRSADSQANLSTLPLNSISSVPSGPSAYR